MKKGHTQQSDFTSLKPSTKYFCLTSGSSAEWGEKKEGQRHSLSRLHSQTGARHVNTLVLR